MDTFKVSGVIVNDSGAPIADAQVHFIGSFATLGDTPSATVLHPTSLVWTRTITGFSGHRWNAYTKYLGGSIAGMSFAEFKDAVVAHNPSLAESGYIFQAEMTYLLPENDPAALDITWDRLLTGFSGNRWQCWVQSVAGKVIGMEWNAFKDQVVERNPALIESGFVFAPEQTYQLPRNPSLRDYEVVTHSSASGRYSVELPPGEYRVEVVYEGRLRREMSVTIADDTTLDFIIAVTVVVVQPSPGFVHRVQSEFRLNGERFGRFVGVNLPHFLHYGDTRKLPHSNQFHKRKQLERVQEVKGRVVRAFLPYHECSNQEIIDRLQDVLVLMKEFDMYLLPAFIDLYNNSGAFPKATNPAVDYFDFQDGTEQRVRLGDAFFNSTNGRYKGFYLTFVEAIVKAISNVELSSRIFAWEIGNELKYEVLTSPPNGNPPKKDGRPDQFVDFNLDVARKIKAWDGGRHMVTTGMLCTRHAYMEHRPDLVRKLYGQDSPIDFITVHAYESGADVDATWAHRLQMPLIVEEAGIAKPQGDYEDRLRADLLRWFEETEYQHNPAQPPEPRQRAAGYMPWRFDPIAIGEGSGNFHDDFNITKKVFHEFI